MVYDVLNQLMIPVMYLTNNIRKKEQRLILKLQVIVVSCVVIHNMVLLD